MTQQATMWQAQLADGTKMRGGQTNIFPDDLNVGAVPIDQMKTFTVSHNTFAYTYYAPTKKWYKDGKLTTFAYPTEFGMQDGSLLTIDFAAGLLVLTQV
ncbi:hypothetical protein [Cohnella yongneupensis]|uniref:Uncharacterized protein n=1 Tax=Cohnella yongneupensis TaxID=425006 RepID=A0ABW0QXY1_9BACL